MTTPPRPAPEHIRPLTAWRYAHRGSHGQSGPLENSMGAFDAACRGGYGIECDLRLSRDGVAFVFHDHTLDRLTGKPGRFEQHSAAELDAIALKDGTGSTSYGPIPRLSALLDLTGDRTPLLLELKIPDRASPAPLCRAVRDDLARVAHQAAIMSFHPGVSRWFARHAPNIPHGLVLSEGGRRGIKTAFFRHAALRYARPQFLAYDIRDLPSAFAGDARKSGLPIFSWTVRTPDEWDRVAKHADAPIFEGEQEAPSRHG